MEFSSDLRVERHYRTDIFLVSTNEMTMKMAWCDAAPLGIINPVSSFSSHPFASSFSQLSGLRVNREHKYVTVIGSRNSKRHSINVTRSVLGNRNFSVDNSENVATDSLRILLDRFFAQTQKLEELSTSEGMQIGFEYETFESGLQAALATLREKEEDLKDAESRVLLERAEISRAKQELEQREKEIAAAHVKQEKIKEDLKQANHDFASQARMIENLKFVIEERDRDIVFAHSALSLKEAELIEMRNKFIKKTEETSRMESQIISNDQILNKANDVIKKQATEVQELKKAVVEKKQELKELANLRKIEKDKLQVAEAKLKNQTVEWLSAQEELKCLTEEAHRHMGASSEALEDFKRVKMLLTDVRSELVSSQKSLAFSWRKMEEHEHQLEKQLGELEVQKLVMIAYTERLRDAESELKNEHAKVRVAEAQNIELEQDLSLEKELIEQLQEELNKEKSSLKQTTQELTLFQNELDQRTYEFKEAQNLLQVKESELVEARLQIQHLHSELASIKLLLEEKDSDLFEAQKKLSDLSGETEQLEELLSSREEQLTKSSKLLQEKDEHVHRIQHELDDTKLKFSEAATVVERLTKLTDQLVDSLKDEEDNALSFLREEIQLPKMEHELLQQEHKKPTATFELQKKQLGTEVEMTRDSLRLKEMEVLAAQRALTVRDEEMKTVVSKLDEKEMQLVKMKQETLDDPNGLNKIYALAQEKVGSKSVGDLALESVQLEAETATSALRTIGNMIGELWKQAGLGTDSKAENIIFQSWFRGDESFVEAQRQVAQLSALTEQLVKEAGVFVVP